MAVGPGRLEDEAAAQALAAWERLWPALHVLELRDVRDRRRPPRWSAGTRCVPPTPCTSRRRCELRSPDLVVAAWDEHLAAAARAEGLLVVP